MLITFQFFCGKSQIAGQDTHSTAIGALWKNYDGCEEQDTLDKKELATSILGKSLVDALVEEKRQPPDVSVTAHNALEVTQHLVL